MEVVFEAKETPDSKVLILRKKVSWLLLILLPQSNRIYFTLTQDPETGAFLYRMKGVVPCPSNSLIGTHLNIQVR